MASSASSFITKFLTTPCQAISSYTIQKISLQPASGEQAGGKRTRWSLYRGEKFFFEAGTRTRALLASSRVLLPRRSVYEIEKQRQVGSA
jgi:hypothetical protein